MEQDGQIAEAGGGGGVVGVQRPLPDLQRPLQERPSGSQLALAAEEAGQVIKADGGGRMIWSCHSLLDVRGALIPPACFGNAGASESHSCRVPELRRLGMVV